jgi:hypothetical protein
VGQGDKFSSTQSGIGDEEGEKGLDGRNALWFLSDVNDQPGWAIGRGKSARDDVFHIPAILHNHTAMVSSRSYEIRMPEFENAGAMVSSLRFPVGGVAVFSAIFGQRNQRTGHHILPLSSRLA